MASNRMIIDVSSQPGIQRDGTEFDSLMYLSGSLMRFYKNRVKKMGGWEVLQVGNQEIIRSLLSYDFTNSILLYMGRATSLNYIRVSSEGTTTSPVDRTPVDYVSDPNNIWNMTTLAVPNVDATYIVATAAPNGVDLANETEGAVYYGIIDQNTPLVAAINGSDQVTTAGGVMVLLNYLIVYGSNGFIFWNDGLSFNSWPSDYFAKIGSSKFVYGAPVRSGDTATGLLWSLDGVVKLTYVGFEGDSQGFLPSYISTTSTILSARSVVDYEPFFFWIGNDCFYIYNGTVSELINNTNKEWFFKNLNWDYKERVYGFVNRQYGEICWLFPKGDSTENNHMIYYNIEKQEWFDTDKIERAAAIASTSQFRYPIMTSSTPESYGNSSVYPVWMHEKGVNKVAFGQTYALTSTFTTHWNNLWMENPEAQVVTIDSIIPDIEQTGNMYVQVNVKAYPNSTAQQSELITLAPDTQFKNIRIKGSLFSFTFTSNELDGDYFMGKTLSQLTINTDQRPGPAS